MKQLQTKTWILLLSAVCLALIGLMLLQKRSARPAKTAQVYLDGELFRTIDLSVDGVYRIESDRGWNELTVRDGKLAVTAASCPDEDCVRCGWQNSGPPITCLPNRMTVRFGGSAPENGVDGVVR
jgi:hypothetical protein